MTTDPKKTEAPKPPVAPDDSSPADTPQGSGHLIPCVEASSASLPRSLDLNFRLVLDQHGIARVLSDMHSNPFLLPVDSTEVGNLIRKEARSQNLVLKRNDVREIQDILREHAESECERVWAYYRVAPISNGIEIDLGDNAHTRIRITPGAVELLDKGSSALLFRSPVTRPFVRPAERGDLQPLKKYTNFNPYQHVLFTGWLSYTLAHPKTPSTKYVILVLQGSQGTGKSFLSKHVILPLLDPSRTGVQVFPQNPKDFIVAAKNAHVLAYDNLRTLKQQMSDMLCVASTGGAISARQLYTDSGLHVEDLHVALVLNGIHEFVDQPDLAQRCLPLQMQPMARDQRQSEKELLKAWEADQPIIFRGLLELIAQVFKHLPDAEVTHPERMIDFSTWLAAMEKVYGAPTGAFQSEYSKVLKRFQRDSLQENALAEALLAFVESMGGQKWEGTPEELLNKLSETVSPVVRRSRDWPSNPIALSKRLRNLVGGFETQNIIIEFTRGKKRRITITTEGAF